MILARRDPFGFEQVIYHRESATCANGIRALRRRQSCGAGELDANAIAGYLVHRRLPDRTVLEDFRALPPGHVLETSSDGLAATSAPTPPRRGDLEALLLASLGRVVRSGRRAAIALSGGLDSALLLALLVAMAARQVPAYILATDMPHYDERAAALATARRLGAEVVVVEVGARDFVDALPDAMRHLEEPIYNLHPVAKLLLARAMRRDGIELAISGDGADQVLARDTSADYLPLCRTLFQAAGVQLVAPFLDADVVAHLVALPPDPHKTCLRDLGRRHGVAAQLTEGAKRRGLAPAMDLDHLLPADGLRTLAATLGMPAPALSTDAQRVQWASLRLLLADLGVAA